MHVGGFRDDLQAFKYAFWMDMLGRKDSPTVMNATYYSSYSQIATSVTVGFGTSVFGAR
jgi:hypothetical protein